MAISGSSHVETGLGGPLDLGEVMIPRGDDNWLAIDVSHVFRGGLRLFQQTYLAPVLYVNTNGTISFGGPVGGYPGTGTQFDHPVLAPFWGDVDTRLDGEGAESGAIWADLETIYGVFTVTWDGVGVYRRNADMANRFQVQMVDQGGGDFDIVFRYEQIEWSIGTAEDDNGAIAGIFDPNAGINTLFGTADTLDQRVGNSGQIGVWAYQVRDGTLLDMSLSDRMVYGSALGDNISGTSGSDTIDAGDGDDFIFALTPRTDPGDTVYGGNGRDRITGGYGGDRLYGDADNDTLTGSAGSDHLFGGAGDDFLNGGWGHDRLTGGAGADRFYHAGVPDHGNDWITDYSAAEGDVLVFGGAASADDFLVQYAHTPSARDPAVREAFVTYLPTKEILWALVDGEGIEITLRLADIDVHIA